MRIIGHLDMDAFFAAVEERDNPRFKGLPIIVGADPKQGRGRGVVSTANYKAREYGIRSALPISKAWRFSEEAKRRGSPPAIFLPGDFEKYSRVSAEIMAIIRGYSPLVEEASVDEAYFDLSYLAATPPSGGIFKKAAEICQELKKEIFKKERLTCSIGIGLNKLIAKIASDFKKPDGLTGVEEKDAEAFLEPLPIRKIPGIGPKTEAKFHALKIKTVKDIKKFSRAELEELLGKWGIELYEKARGRDESPIQTEWVAKSIGEQETFGQDTLEANFVLERLNALCQSVAGRLLKEGFKNFKTVSITVRFSDFETKTRAHMLAKPANDTRTLQVEALKLLLPFLDKRANPALKQIRLIGVKMEKLK
ncbi:MAG: DNA polymerase IV [Patescibacteria group bacterium]